MNFTQRIESKSFLNKVNNLEDKYKEMTNEQLQEESLRLKELYNGKDEILNSDLPDAFALAREATFRVLNKRHYDVQVIGGYYLHKGYIIEMKTGEGKTLTEILATYVNALTGKGVHIITVNDYLAERDATEMGKVFSFLGLSVGRIFPNMPGFLKKEAYLSDITYGTATEFGFDYLKDNMVTDLDKKSQRGLNYVVIDEVDSILIDEARTPLIISNKGDEQDDFMLIAADTFVKDLIRGEDINNSLKGEEEDRHLPEERAGGYRKNTKTNQMVLTEYGLRDMMDYFGVYDTDSEFYLDITHKVKQALHANFIMEKDVDYLIKKDEIMIIDSGTGRTMEGRRFSLGLHQALEVKEGVDVKSENVTSATITLQSFFKMYNKVSGMTGTIMTEKEEMKEVYGIDVIDIPTNKPVIREDRDDLLFITKEDKYNALVNLVKKTKEMSQDITPILIGVASVKESEIVHRILKDHNIEHKVLNAKNDKVEANIIAEAGVKGAVTIATNMAGRGTDILLGGNPEFYAKKELFNYGLTKDEVEIATNFIEYEEPEYINLQSLYKNKFLKEAEKKTQKAKEEIVKHGGLLVIGVEKNDSIRVDNQLRGRAGRQGEPGTSIFLFSMEDDLIENLNSGTNTFLRDLKELAIQETEPGQPVENKLVIKSIDNAKSAIENSKYHSRKHLKEYGEVDDVFRENIYKLRDKLMSNVDDEEIKSLLRKFYTNGSKVAFKDMLIELSELPIDEKAEMLKNVIEVSGMPKEDMVHYNIRNDKHLRKWFLENMEKVFDFKYKYFEQMGLSKEDITKQLQEFALSVVDDIWINYLVALDNIKHAVQPLSMVQIDGLKEYKDRVALLNSEFYKSLCLYIFNAYVTLILESEVAYG